MAPRLRSANALHNVLPEEALRVLFLALPVDARARAACVCRAWRAFLADPTLWQVLDLTPDGGVAAERVTENLVRGAVARAAGGMRELSSGRYDSNLLVRFIESDGAELQQVSTDDKLRPDQLAAIFAAAPRLQTLNADVGGHCTDLLPFLRNGLLRVSDMLVHVMRPDEDEATVHAFAAAVAAHKSLKRLRMFGRYATRGINALFDAAAECRIPDVMMVGTFLNTESVPALARLLLRGSLTELAVRCDNFPDADEASVLALCDALRACRTLTRLELQLNPPQGANRRVVAELLDAAASLPVLSTLSLYNSRFQDVVEAGRAFGALLRANQPSLRVLDVQDCSLGDDGVAPILDGLAANTHLWYLSCGVLNGLSEEFERDRLQPALAELEARRELDA